MGKTKASGRTASFVNVAKSSQITATPAQVDSWRSYRNDSTNLQSLADFEHRSALNPSVPDFIPLAQQNQNTALYSHYSALRTSHGSNEWLPMQYARLYSTLQASATNGIRFHQAAQVPAVLDAHQLTLSSVEPAEDATKLANSGSDPRYAFRKVQSRSPNTEGRSSISGTHRRRAQFSESPPAPEPKQAYFVQAALEPVTVQDAQKLLVILDLNGTLLFRKDRAHNPTNFQLRPGVTRLLDYLFTHHVVMIFTSTRPENAHRIISKLLHPNHRQLLAAVWARDKLGLSEKQYVSKVQVYKNLENVWADETIQSTAGNNRRWDQSNTILVDDSHLKALAQPSNLLQVPEFVNDRPQDDTAATKRWIKDQQDIVGQLELKLEALKWTADVSRMIRQWQNLEKPQPKVDGQAHPVNEAIDQAGPYSEYREDSMAHDNDNGQLLTPRSLPDIDDPAEGYSHEGTKKTDPDRKRSVSPIDESVWRELLEMDTDGHSTHKSGIDPSKEGQK